MSSDEKLINIGIQGWRQQRSMHGDHLSEAEERAYGFGFGDALNMVRATVSRKWLEKLESAIKDLIESYDLAQDRLPDIAKDILRGFFINIENHRALVTHVETQERERDEALIKSQTFTVGQYTISPLKEGYLLEHESGDGFVCKRDSLEALLTQFFADNC